MAPVPVPTAQPDMAYDRLELQWLATATGCKHLGASHRSERSCCYNRIKTKCWQSVLWWVWTAVLHGQQQLLLLHHVIYQHRHNTTLIRTNVDTVYHDDYKKAVAHFIWSWWYLYIMIEKCLRYFCQFVFEQQWVWLVGWSLTSLFGTNAAISETRVSLVYSKLIKYQIHLLCCLLLLL